MPTNNPNKEPDEELPFPKFNLAEIKANPEMTRKVYWALLRYARSRNIMVRHLRMENKTLYQQILILTKQIAVQNEALNESKESKESKRRIDGFTFILGVIASAVITLGASVAFLSKDYVVAGWFIIIFGFLIAIATGFFLIFTPLGTRRRRSTK